MSYTENFPHVIPSSFILFIEYFFHYYYVSKRVPRKYFITSFTTHISIKFFSLEKCILLIDIN